MPHWLQINREARWNYIYPNFSLRFECSTYLFLTFFIIIIISDSNNNNNRVTIQITMQLCHTCFKMIVYDSNVL